MKKYLFYFLLFAFILNFIQTASIIYQIDDDATVNELWNSFKLKFNRTYDSSADSQRFVFNAFIYFFFIFILLSIPNIELKYLKII